MRFPFREFPIASGGDLTPRPMLDVWLEGIDVMPFAGLLDTGALRTRFSADLADLAGVDLAGAATERFAVGGVEVQGAAGRVSLRIAGEGLEHRWDAAVWFCDPWPFAFQLLGLDGFLRHFRITLSAYEEWVDCQPEG